jgi:hypothetical protein
MTLTRLKDIGMRFGGALLLVALLLGICTLAGVQYNRWREGLLGTPFHQDAPLGKISLGGLHFGACLTDVEGGSLATYCDGFPTPAPGSGLPLNPKSAHVWLGPKKGNAITFCFVRGGNDTVIVVPLP